MLHDVNYIPTQAEIRNECRKIQRGWSEREYAKRRQVAVTASTRLIQLDRLDDQTSSQLRRLAEFAPVT